MINIYTEIYADPARLAWDVQDIAGSEEAIKVVFVVFGNYEERHSLKEVERVLGLDVSASNPFLRRVGQNWSLDPVRLCERFPERPELQKILTWLNRPVPVTPKVTLYKSPIHDNKRPSSLAYRRVQTLITFTVWREDYERNAMQKIFLSHKGADKPQVKRIKSSLDLLGFDTWLDEDAMPAGTELHRGIHQGFQDSCAAVFFITPNFVDEKYLQQEINYAIEQKTKKGTRFAIITLVFSDNEGKKGKVPEILHSYVWKEPAGELEALNEIVKALPIKVGQPYWREGL